MANQQPYNYGGYSQYYNVPAPPQPHWQAPAPPRLGWVDPRQQQNQNYGQQPPLQAPAPSPSSYNPNQYGPMPGASPAQAQGPQPTWGVKYQQPLQQQQYQQHPEAKPPLPPRPSSATGRVDSSTAPYLSQSQGQWQTRPNDGQFHISQSFNPSEPWATNYGQYQSTTGAPLPPPKVSQEHYAQKPLSHHHEPSTDPNWAQTSAGNHFSTFAGQEPFGIGYAPLLGSQSQTLVSPVDRMSSSWIQPEDANTVPLSQTTTNDHYHPVQTPLQGDLNFDSHLPSQAATALGYGGPSDWEHFAPDSHTVSPEISHSIPTDSKAPENGGETRPENTIHQLHQSKTSNNRVEQHMPQSRGTLSSPSESLSPDAGNINSVIHAWNAPLQPRKQLLRDNSANGSPSLQGAKPSFIHSQNQVQLQELRAQTSTPQSLLAATPIPYSNLEPQFQASLARFVDMLRKESLAESEAEKFKIFENFVRKETKLRAVLYDIDLMPPQPEVGTQEITRDKELSPPGTERAVDEPQHQAGAHSSSGIAPHSPPAVQQEGVQDGLSTPSNIALSKVEWSLRSKDDSFVVVDPVQGSEMSAYSPGGRPLIPLIPRPITVNTQFAKVASIMTKPASPTPKDRSVPSPSDNAPQVVGEDYADTGPLSPELSAPIVLTALNPESSPQLNMTATSRGPLSMPVKFEPSRPVYTPFRYAEGSQNQPGHLDLQRPADQDYLSKRNTYDSSRLMASETSPNVPDIDRVSSPTAVKKAQEEVFLGLLRSHSTVRPKVKAMNVPDSIRPRTTPPSSQMRPNPIRDAVIALRSSLPPTLPEKKQNDKVAQIRHEMGAFADNFSFIRDVMIGWDRENREVRKRLDEERHRRQEESETRLDELFNDNEIAYAELKGMETDFKLAEAERRYEEDKQELESFTQGVYNVVTTKLQQQVNDLNKLYVLAVDLLDLESDSASRMLRGDTGRSSMSEAMDVVLQLFEKLNIRHRKLAEARFERERRRKRLECE